MNNAIGASALRVALGMAVLAIVLAVWGVRRRNEQLVRAAYSAVYANALLVTLATGAMLTALLTHDFSVKYVSQVGSRATPTLYTIASLWGALEGSILFWGWVLSLYAAAVIYVNRARIGALVPYAAATLMGIATFFGILLVGPANPFGLVVPTPLDGPGPNPLLQNHPLMAVHPPLLYLGYVGMSVPFAFAIGAMLAGELDDDAWIVSTRRWTIIAWGFLSAAIIAGMWWSYEVLGWGGYWAWDPVENASFMPWLTATAFLHSVLLQQRRGMLKLWNMCLVVCTFVLTILGTFLTRSGILSSVHAFTQGAIGYYFLAFIAIVLLFSLVLIAGQSGKLRAKNQIDAVVSRESVFLLNNLFFAAFTFTVVLGTLFPLVAEALRGVKVSVGAPFFNKMTLPLGMALIFLAGVGPALPWKRASREELRSQLLPPAIALVVVLVSSIALGVRDIFAVLTFAFAAFALTSNVREFWTGARARMRAQGESPPVALARLVSGNRHRYGGYVAHMGIVCIVVAIAASTTFKSEQEGTLRPGGTLVLQGITVRLDRVWGQEQAQRFVVGADVTLLKGERVIGELTPRQNFYPASEQPVPTPSVRARADADIYINLMAFDENGASATIRVLIEPLVSWIWLGGLIVVLGALISAWPQRRRDRAGALSRASAGTSHRPLAPLGASPAVAKSASTASVAGD
ncbi:MAG: heme lyase CcmF/NrfE family subunit [Gemmatimonadota bacterium]|nr:heme lyase CcmF/NrfE family subunit [Gemmatimonadota bacterium]